MLLLGKELNKMKRISNRLESILLKIIAQHTYSEYISENNHKTIKNLAMKYRIKITTYLKAIVKERLKVR